MNKIRFLIGCAIVWAVIAGLVTWSAAFSGYGIEVPNSMPVRLALGILSLIGLVLLFGWVVPLAIGIHMLLKRRGKQSV